MNPLSVEEDPTQTEFHLSTLRDVCWLRAGSTAERDHWIATLREARRTTIRQQLGHVPLSEDERLLRKAGTGLVRARLRREMEETEQLARQYTAAAGGGFAAPM